MQVMIVQPRPDGEPNGSDMATNDERLVVFRMANGFGWTTHWGDLGFHVWNSWELAWHPTGHDS